MTVVFTIASNNYLGFASVLASSVREHHPNARVLCCIVDRPSSKLAYDDFPFESLFVEDLEIPGFDSMAMRYDQLELNTAVKPFVFRHLRDAQGVDRALYFDPDIWVHSPLQEALDALEDGQAVLTPHITEPLDDSYHPSEPRLRMSGIYNLGFVGLRLDETTARFLDWWCDRLHRACYVDPKHGVFVDQSWMDFTPAFLDRVRILRHPGYNVAYWNLAHRRLAEREGAFLVNGEPLRFFHFSGVDLEDFETVSKHQDRIAMDDRPELRPLFRAYAEAVSGATDRSLRDEPYTWSSFDGNGPRIPTVARRLLARVDPLGERWPSPFQTESAESFLGWLLRPLEFPGGVLNRILLAVWEESQWATDTFPDVCGEDLLGFWKWFTEGGGSEMVGLDSAYWVNLLHHRWTSRSAGAPLRFLPHSEHRAVSTKEMLSKIDLSWPGYHVAWLNSQVRGVADSPRLTYLAMAIYGIREDLQREFPRPLGEDLERYARWFCVSGREEFQLADELVAPVLSSFSRRDQRALVRL